MDAQLLLQLLGTGLDILKQHSSPSGIVAKDAAVAEQLAYMVRLANQVYEQHVGEPLNPDNVKPEEKV